MRGLLSRFAISFGTSHPLLLLTSPQGRSQAEGCLGPSNVLGEPHIHVHFPEQNRTAAGKRTEMWPQGKLWTISILPLDHKFFTPALLDCNHQQSFPAHTTYPTKITSSNTRSYIQGKTLLPPLLKQESFLAHALKPPLWTHAVVEMVSLLPPSSLSSPTSAVQPGSTA